MLAGLSSLSAMNFYGLMQTEEGYNRQREIFETQPTVERAKDRFLEKALNARSVEEFVDDFEVRQYLTQAYGLEGDLAASPAFIKQVLTEDLGKEDALVYRLNDQRFLKMASDLRLDQGLENIQDPLTIAFVNDKYETVGLEQAVGNENLAVREALYFKRTIGEVETPFQILADNPLRAVVFGVLGIPAEVAYQGVDKQAEAITDRIDIEDFQDPEYVENFISRYLITADSQTDQTGGMASLIQPLSLNGSGSLSDPVIYSLDVNLLV